ncbi:MAG: WD40 repeat domain-containing protein, partial [Solirubrobacteraceae bacterium]
LALSPAGATVGRLIGRALGVRHAAPALFSLPAPGRLLVSGPGGTWTIAANGSARRIGRWSAASWSPHGRYLAVTDRDAVAAVNPRGVVQWALARPDVSDLRWYSPTGYRLAYLSGGALRVLAGDGTGDHLLAVDVAHVAPAWRPGHPYQLAYMTAAGRLVVRDGDTGATLWSARPRTCVRRLAWSADGERLLVLSRTRVLVYAADGRLITHRPAPGGGQIVDGALSPDGRIVALISGGPSSGAILERLTAPESAGRRVLAGVGLGQVEWSPNGRWLLVNWPAADQWVFVRVAGRPRIAAVSNIARQFATRGASGTHQRLEGWCCAAAGARR